MMSGNDELSRWGLQRGFGYRVGLCLLSLPLLVGSTVCLACLPALLGRPQDWVDLVIQMLVWEFFIALVVVSALALVWSIATPDWVERWVNHHAWVLTVAVYLFIPGFLAVLRCLLR